MNDKDFDKLIAESFERDRVLESINRSVMKEINRTERKTLLHCVLKLVGMAFGIPLVGISGASAIISSGMEKAGSDIVLAALVLSLIVFALSALMMLMKFSSESFVIISRAACHKDELKNINN